MNTFDKMAGCILPVHQPTGWTQVVHSSNSTATLCNIKGFSMLLHNVQLCYKESPKNGEINIMQGHPIIHVVHWSTAWLLSISQTPV